MSTRTSALALQRRVEKLRGKRAHGFRAPTGVVLQLADDAVLDGFFALMGGRPSGLSDRARAHLATVPEGLMADVHAALICDARGDWPAVEHPPDEHGGDPAEGARDDHDD